MNWYKLLKFSQIWNVNYRQDSVQSCLEALYQLTYKYQQMQTQQFKGYPTRKENMLMGIEKESKKVISVLVDLLLPVFEKWLREHALTNPKAWAEDMLEYQNEIGISPQDLAIMINSFTFGNKQDRQKIDDNYITESIDEAIKTDKAKNFARWLSEVQSENRDEYDLPQKQNNENMDFSEFFSTYYESNWEYLFQSISEFDDIGSFAEEVAEFALFPAWYDYWRMFGIDETRARLENAHRMLIQVQSQPINQALATINIVINTCHQTGDMLEYIVDATGDSKGELYRAMNNLSSLTHNSPEMIDWNKDLRQVGTKIPRPPKIPKSVEEPMDNDTINNDVTKSMTNTVV